MDQHALEYYTPYSDLSPQSHFHAVIPLHDQADMDWSMVSQLTSNLCRHWYELAQLSLQDRIDFTKEFWLTKLPYCPLLDGFLTKFFASLDDIGVFLTQQKFDDPFKVHMVYSLAGNGGFFHGEHYANESDLIDFQKNFPNHIFPTDYLAFLQIHNGFAKLTDTGIISSHKMKESYEDFKKIVDEEPEPILTSRGVPVNPSSLIPFYESFGMPFFQCFWADWYPDQEMGNVYYSAHTRRVSDCKKKDDCIETMAFERFTDWLLFYLEKIE